MTGTDYAVLISTPADTKDDFDYLYRVLCTLDKELSLMAGEDNGEQRGETLKTSPKVPISSDHSYMCQDNDISSEDILGLIGTKSVDNIYVYPPGSYLLTEGEVITESIALKLIEYVEQGKEIRGRLF